MANKKIPCAYCGKECNREEFPYMNYAKCRYCVIEELQQGFVLAIITAGLVIGLITILAGWFT